MILQVHMLAGLLAIACGAAALAAAKGGKLHRKAGGVFVCSMLALGATGAGVAIVRQQPLNVVAGSLAFYLVATGWLTMQPASALVRRMGIAAMLLGSLVALGGLAFGAAAVSEGRTAPAAFLLVFGGLAALGARGDWRMLARGAAGPRRLARHLWRMGLAMLLATMSFFLGQAKVFPVEMQRPALLAIPVLLVLVTVLYWLGQAFFANKRTTA